MTDISEPRHQRPQPHEMTWHADPTGPSITLENGLGLMHCLRAERPDWTADDIMAVLDRFRDKKPRALRKAAFALAETPGTTPEDLDTDGPWWQDKPKLATVSPISATPAPLVPPATNDTSPMCPRHPTLHAWECKADQCKPKAHGRPAWFNEVRETEKERADRERAERAERLAAAMAEDEKRLAKLGHAPWRAGEKITE